MLFVILFLFNTIASVMAESAHIEIETHTSSIAHTENHHHHSEDAPTSDPNNDHCPDHDECHNGHFHHYIIFPLSNFSVTITFTYFNHPVIQNSYVSNVLEIIKPPLLLA